MERKGNIFVVDHQDNLNHIVKLIHLYQQQCDPEQSRFFCYPDNNLTAKFKFKCNKPYGPNQIVKYVKEVAESADFKDFSKYTPHQNRKRMGTNLYSNKDIPDAVKMMQMRHSKMASGITYTHQN